MANATHTSGAVRSQPTVAVTSATHTPGTVRSQPAAALASATHTPGAVMSQLAVALPSATHTPGAVRSQPGKVSGKRKREIEPPPGSSAEEEEVVERKYGLDIDILECPICSEPFSPPVYQCPGGHTTCSACCKKMVNKKCPTCSQPTGTIRCIAIEKILESLLVSCKYAPNGCQKMLKQTGIQKHEKDRCTFKPFRCPVSNCSFEGSNVTLLVHLAEEHRVRTIAHNSISGAGLMDSSEYLMMVKGYQETDMLFIVHRESHETPETGLGEVFFCTSFGTSYKSYDLKVKLCSCPSLSYSMVGACAINLLDHWKKDSFERDFLLLPFFRLGAKWKNCAAEVLFKLSSNDDLEDSDDD